MPSATRRQRWVAGLAALEPDLVIDTGDNLAHQQAVPFVLRGLGRLLDRPGVYVWGSNDYYAPQFKNPLGYLVEIRDTLPMSAVGKILYRVLRDEHAGAVKS